MNEQFNNVAEIGSEGDAADKNKVDVEIRQVLQDFSEFSTFGFE